jgi:hypothetical protein
MVKPGSNPDKIKILSTGLFPEERFNLLFKPGIDFLNHIP